ncbi:MAG: hypothetical protein H6686_04570 [Fibrobacteria bacterium]|nr:hypothetical protein [Fibrobacteria bacterium]
MKTIHLFLAFILLGGASQAAEPDFSQVGFSTMGGGTTGGQGGKVVTPVTLEELKAFAEDPATPYVIRITQEFNSGKPIVVDGVPSTYGDVIRLGSNKTLVGIGDAAFFQRIGLNIQCRSNIIIRNIRFTMRHVPYSKDGENKVVGLVDGVETLLGDPDCIGIQADDESVPESDRVSRNIWIDHNEFFNEDPAVMTDKDRYDGLVDTKNNSYNITISWNYFHDHHKASLIGKGGSDSADHKTTYHHNYFRNIAARLPLFRYGVGHLFNNLMVASENGANARVNSDLYIEANVFQDSKKPVFGKVSENGAATLVDNRWIGCDRVPATVLSEAPGAAPLSASEEILPGKFRPSSVYSYAPVLHRVDEVAEVVPRYSGVGKINTGEYDPPVSSPPLSRDGAFEVRVRGGEVRVQAPPGVGIELLDARGMARVRVVSTGGPASLPVPRGAGFYLLRVGSASRGILVP